MQRDQRFQQQNSISRNQDQQENTQRIQNQSSLQYTQGLCFISALLYGVMILILVTLILSIIAISQNIEQQQVVYLCILLILLLTALFGCTVYIKLQFSEAEKNQIKMHNEVQMNIWVYSTHYFFFQYTNQSKFILIRLTYLYCVFSIYFLAQNIIYKTYYECYDEKNDHHYQTDSLDENQDYDDCIRNEIPAKFQGPMLIPLGTICLIVSFTFFVYEIIKICQQIYLIYKFCIYPFYQYDMTNINIPQVIIQTKVFFTIFFINNLGKFISLLVIILLTPNNSSYILISSNLFYYFVMMIFILSFFFQIAKLDNNYQQNNNLEFVDYQLLIDSLLRRSNNQNIIFKLFITICLIFTIVGISLFENQMDRSYVIINYDIFIEYDSGIVQLIFLGLMFIKYLIIPLSSNQNIRNLTQINQQVYVQNQEHQQIIQQQQQPQQGVNQIQINNNIQINLPQKRLVPISNINKNFIYQVILKDKTDCTICLQQLIQNSQENPIVQLKCHISHIFHQKCIQDWLTQIKKCPICNIEFS
ncbi:unnamed protein product [Paramecium pentaurelia]|uniref:RING-type domain-containing protein n=1 Tax=Paramecium pentaurelia TaxID=43138 RepID=A0A8S1UNI3_9CILI|nr:unnamed protein product [Paramecium pentaurelia]